MQSAEYKMPIYITETGIADKKDGNRSHMIDEYMRAVRAKRMEWFASLLWEESQHT